MKFLIYKYLLAIVLYTSLNIGMSSQNEIVAKNNTGILVANHKKREEEDKERCEKPNEKKCPKPLRIGKDGFCLLSCERARWQVKDRQCNCVSECPKQQSMNEAGECVEGCPYEAHMGYDGMCIQGCPEADSLVVDIKTGKCIYEEFNEKISKKYAIVIGVSVLVLVILGAVVLAYQTFYVGKRKRCEIESHLAVALAQIHTLDKVKSQRETVDIGVGSNQENLKEWVTEIWDKYAVSSNNYKHDNLLRRNEFDKFVRTAFKMSTFQYKYTHKEFQELYDLIEQDDGKISKKAMGTFLKSLKNVQPPNLQNITQITNEDVEGDNSFVSNKSPRSPLSQHSYGDKKSSVGVGIPSNLPGMQGHDSASDSSMIDVLNIKKAQKMQSYDQSEEVGISDRKP